MVTRLRPAQIYLPSAGLIGVDTAGGDGKIIPLGSGLSFSGGSLVNTGGLSDGDKGDVVVASSGTVWTVESASKAFGFTGVISPATISSSQNDWAPTGIADATTINIACSPTVNITGIVGGYAGRIIILRNNTTTPVILKHFDSGSSTGNRFYFASLNDMVLQRSQCAIFQHSTVWVCLTPNTTSGANSAGGLVILDGNGNHYLKGDSTLGDFPTDVATVAYPLAQAVAEVTQSYTLHSPSDFYPIAAWPSDPTKFSTATMLGGQQLNACSQFRLRVTYTGTGVGLGGAMLALRGFKQDSPNPISLSEGDYQPICDGTDLQCELPEKNEGVADSGWVDKDPGITDPDEYTLALIMKDGNDSSPISVGHVLFQTRG